MSVSKRQYEFSYEQDAFPLVNRVCRMRNVPVKFDVLLTSYEMVSVDYTTLRYINWDIVVIDEAHRLKNNQSLVSNYTKLLVKITILILYPRSAITSLLLNVDSCDIEHFCTCYITILEVL